MANSHSILSRSDKITLQNMLMEHLEDSNLDDELSSCIQEDEQKSGVETKMIEVRLRELLPKQRDRYGVIYELVILGNVKK